MYLIKQYLITNRAIKKIIKFILESNINAYQIGLEISLLYYFIYEEQKSEIDNNKNLQLIICNFLFKNNDNLNNSQELKLLKFLSPLINYNIFFNKFNKQLFKITKEKLTSYFRGYYINVLNLYGNNIMLNKLENNIYKITNDEYYFVLYDFHNIYLNYIYGSILNTSIFPCKIKYLISTYYDKYSINEITDDINYRLVFIHKKKYYINSVKLLLEFLFYNITNIEKLQTEDEKNVFKIYKSTLEN